MSEREEKPEWWVENEQLREFLDLPDYTPPRFSDGTYTHEVIPELERRYDCTIQLIGVNVEYLDDWEIRLDREPIDSIGHTRDENGNTVYEIDAEQFREIVVGSL